METTHICLPLLRGLSRCPFSPRCFGEPVYTSVITNTGERQPALSIITHEIQRVKHKIEMKSRSALWWLISLFQVCALILITPELSTLPLEESLLCQGFCHSRRSMMKRRRRPIFLSAGDKPRAHSHTSGLDLSGSVASGEHTYSLQHRRNSLRELNWIPHSQDGHFSVAS